MLLNSLSLNNIVALLQQMIMNSTVDTQNMNKRVYVFYMQQIFKMIPINILKCI